MPMTRSLGNPLTLCARVTIASTGLETTIRTVSGEPATTFWVTSRTMPALILSRSSRVMPGLRATPEVMTTMSDPAVSS
jgi:hypothetical protein